MPYTAESAEIFNFLERLQSVDIMTLEQLWIWIKMNLKLKIVLKYNYQICKSYILDK